MDVGSVVQVGGAVQHNPLPPLSPFVEQVGSDNAGDSSGLARHLATPVIGGFIGCGQLAWRAIGPTLEIFDTLSSTRQAAWTFGAILHSSSAKVTCVCGIGVGTLTHVAVGIDLGSERKPQGMVGILSLQRSRITRAFHFQHKVTNICMITGGEKLVDPSTLASELRHCRGLLSVATAHAFLYLVDIALDMGADEVTSDEVSPASYASISVPDPNAEVTRNRAIGRKSHPLLCLSDSMNSGGQFRLLGPDDNILFETASHSVSITSMVYVPQLASLIIGYNFGAFQIINLSLITVDCTSPYEENMAPVFSVAYQEPEHDPRSFVYLWICRSFGFTGTPEVKSAFGDKSKSASCTLYAMNYEKKEWIEGHGLWYQILLSISPRFDFDLKSLPSQAMTGYPSKMFSAVTVVGATPSSSAASPLNSAGGAAALTPTDEESGPVPELSLCMFCWEATFLERGRVTSKHYIAIFDINQWYQAQMPQRICIGDESLSPYMSFHGLDKVPKSLGENLLSAIPRLGSWSRHTSKSTCENDWFPSSLSYDLLLLTSQSLVTYRCPSIQQRAISAIILQGPKAIVYPHASHTACIFASILPPDCLNNVNAGSVVQERENLLNVALEYDLLPLLIQCTHEFSEGLFSHLGCSLELLLQWAWSKVHFFKSSYDALCAPLFKSSLEAMSDESLVVLHQNLSYLSHLSTIITAIRDNSTDVTMYSKRSLDGRVQVVKIFQMHLQATLWFYHCGLLPQYITDEQLDENTVPFPASALQKSYDARYSEIRKLSSSLKASEILLIDAVIEEDADELSEIWEKEDRMAVGVYPPPSLHALLNMYMLPGLPLTTKHRIIQYLFLDLASILSDSYSSVVEELVKFPSSFSLSPSVIKITQAFWLIDHGFFQEGLDVLMHPLVNPDDVTSSQHRRIIKSFLYQGEEKLAITYNQIRQPPHEELEDVRLNLTVLLANGRIREAFHYQQMHRVRLNAKDLLNHFFVGCQQIGSLEALVHLPLSIMEEESFVAYLRASSHPAAQDILLSYYVQQSRYSEIGIFQVNTAGQRQSARSALVHGYLTHLPSIQSKKVSSPKPVRTIYRKPKPFSACIRQSACASTPRTKSTSQRLNALKATVGHRDGRTGMAPFTPFRSRVQRRKAIGSWNEEMGLVSDSSLLDDEINKDETCIVFPTLLENETERTSSPMTPHRFSMQEAGSQEFNIKPLVAKGSHTENDALKQNVSYLMEEVLRKSINTSSVSTPGPSKGLSRISTDVLSLLKTPPVNLSSARTQKEIETYSETPQSILKVRKILQRSISPANFNESAPSSLPSQKSLKESLTAKKQEEPSQSEFLSITPKQLRFHLPSGQPTTVGEHHTTNLMAEFEWASEDGGELPSTPSSVTSLRSTPDSQTSSESPSPRKPLPGYVEREQKSAVVFHEEMDEHIENTHHRIENEKAEDPLLQSIGSSSLPSKRNPIRFHSDGEFLANNASASDSSFLSVTKDANASTEQSYREEPSLSVKQTSRSSSRASLDDSFHSFEEASSRKQSSAAFLSDEVMDVDGQLEEASDEVFPLDINEDELQEPCPTMAVTMEPEISSNNNFQENVAAIFERDMGFTPIISEEVLEGEKGKHSNTNVYDCGSEVCTNSSELNASSVPTQVISLEERNFDPLEKADNKDIDQTTNPECLELPKLDVSNPIETYHETDKALDLASDLENDQANTNDHAIDVVNATSVPVVRENPETSVLSMAPTETPGKRDETYDHIYEELDSTLDIHLQGMQRKNNMPEFLKSNAILDKDEVYSQNEPISESTYVLKFSDSEDESDSLAPHLLTDKKHITSNAAISDKELIDQFENTDSSELIQSKPAFQDDTKSHEESEPNFVLRFSDSEEDEDTPLVKDLDECTDLSRLRDEVLPSSNKTSSNVNSDFNELMPITLTDEENNWLEGVFNDERELCTNVDDCSTKRLNKETECSANGTLLKSIEESSSPVQGPVDDGHNVGESLTEIACHNPYTTIIEEKADVAQASDVILNNNSENTKLNKDSLESCENECQEQKRRKNSELPSLQGSIITTHNNISITEPKICLDEMHSESDSVPPDTMLPVVQSMLHTRKATPKNEAPLTPIRRSRRLSGLSNDGEEGADEMDGRLTPVRRSRRLSGLSHSEDEGDNDLISLQTPLRRTRKVSGSSSIVSKSVTPKRRGRKPSGNSDVEKTPHTPLVSRSLSLFLEVPSKLDTEQLLASEDAADVMMQMPLTPAKDPSKDAIPASVTPTPRLSPGRSRRQKSLLGTPEIVVRRSARLSCTPDILGTIMEEKNVVADSPCSQKTPSKDNKLNASKNTPSRSRRRSLNQSVVLDPNLESIEEHVELLSTEDAASSTECLAKTVEESLVNHIGKGGELLNGPHPLTDDSSIVERQTRRRSHSSSDSQPSTQEQVSNAKIKSPARRRRASISTLTTEGSNEVSIGYELEASDSAAVSSDNRIEDLNYKLLSPVATNLKVSLNRKSTLLVPNSTIGVSKTQILGRKSICSLSQVKDYDISIDETKYSRRKSRLKCETPSSILVLKQHKNHAQHLNDFSINTELVFEQEEGSFQSRVSSPKDEQSPAIEYNLITITPETPVPITLHKSKKRKTSYRRTTQKLSAPKDYQGFSDEEEAPRPRPKKSRRTPSTKGDSSGLSSAEASKEADFVFSKPDVVEEVPIDVVHSLIAEDPATNPSFVFSPPHNEKLKNKASVKKKSTRKKR